MIAIVVNALIILLGVQAWRSPNARWYPRRAHAVVSVSTVCIDASAGLMRSFVTTPLERAIASADGIDDIEPKSLLGFSMISAPLELNCDQTKALADITAKVNQVRNELPPEAETPSTIVESADSQCAAADLRFSSDVLTQSEITDHLARVVQPRLSARAAERKRQHEVGPTAEPVPAK